MRIINNSATIILFAIIMPDGSARAECENHQNENQYCWYECETDDLCQKVCTIQESGIDQRLRVIFDHNENRVDDRHNLKYGIDLIQKT